MARAFNKYLCPEHLSFEGMISFKVLVRNFWIPANW